MSAFRDTYIRKFQPRSPLLFAWSTNTFVTKILWFKSTDLSMVAHGPRQFHESSTWTSILENFIRKYFAPVHCIFELFMNEIVNFLIPPIALVFDILKTSPMINMSLADNQFILIII